MKYLLIVLLLFSFMPIQAQNKSAYTWVVGNNASYGKFDGTTNKPVTASLYQITEIL